VSSTDKHSNSVKKDKGKDEREVLLDWKDYIAFIIALLTTNLLPFVLLILVIIMIAIVFIFLK